MDGTEVTRPGITRYMLTALMILATAHLWAAQPDTGHISQIGLYHGDEWNAAPGDHWLALVSTESGFALRKTAVSVTMREDPLSTLEGLTGKDVATDLSMAPLLLMSGIEGLKPGPVQTAHSIRTSLKPSETIPLKYGNGTSYSVYTGGTRENDHMYSDYTITLETSSAEASNQLLLKLPQLYDESYPTLLWAGDLDHDGRLDLLMDLTDHYNVQHLALFLSSHAAEGELLGLVAELRTTGC